MKKSISGERENYSKPTILQILQILQMDKHLGYPLVRHTDYFGLA